MKVEKVLLTLVATLLVMAGLMGCAGPPSPAPAPPPGPETKPTVPDKVTPSKPAHEIARVGDFQLAFVKLEREEDMATIDIAVTKNGDTGSAPHSVPVTLIDDHGNQYSEGLTIDLEGEPAILNALPKGFCYVATLNIRMPEMARIEIIKVGDQEIVYEDVQFGQPSLRQDFGPFTVEPGAQISLGKYLSVTIESPSAEVSGWTLPITVESTEYNPLFVDIRVGTQFVDGQVRWNRLGSKEIPGSGQSVLHPKIKLSSVDDARYGWSSPGMLILRFSSQSGEVLKVMAVTCDDFPLLPERIAFSRETRTSAMSSPLQVMRPDGSGTMRLGDGYHPAWSPDGSRIAFSDSSRDIYVMNADGSGRVRLTSGDNPAWSPDGCKLAFDSNGHIYVINVDGSRKSEITKGYSPAWSPDGSRIAFNSARDIYVINADGSGRVRLTSGDNPAWSPDGRSIAFDGGAWSSHVTAIGIVDANGSNQRSLGRPGDVAPAWSPDGRRIAFAIGIISVDGSGRTVLGRGFSPAWAPATPLCADTAKRATSGPAAAAIPPLRWPLPGAPDDRRVLLGFGEDWVHGYCEGMVKIHTGIDVVATKGEDICAAEAGEVRWIGSTGGHPEWKYGIVIQHSDFTTLYWHVDLAVDVGDMVAKGERIGVVADLGENTHLHFGVRLASYSEISIRGALPQTECGGDPAFPERFVDPRSITYTEGGTASPKKAASLPDLIVASVRVKEFEVSAGEPITYYYTVANAGAEGPVGTSTFDVATYFSRDQTLDASDRELVWGYSAWTYHLSAGWSHEHLQAARVPLMVPPGNYYVIVLADAKPNQPPNYYPGVTESNEQNNWLASSVAITVR